jgi:hypothetical protein
MNIGRGLEESIGREDGKEWEGGREQKKSIV